MNNELLQQNSDLRLECARLKSKLDAMGATIDQMEDSESSLSIARALPNGVMEEVGRILNPKTNMLPRLYPPRKFDQQVQTNPDDALDPTLEDEIKNLHQERDRLKVSYWNLTSFVASLSRRERH